MFFVEPQGDLIPLFILFKLSVLSTLGVYVYGKRNKSIYKLNRIFYLLKSNPPILD